MICLVTIMMAGAVESWLRGELTQTPEELTRRIDMMFQDYIRGRGPSAEGSCRCIRIENEEGVFL